MQTDIEIQQKQAKIKELASELEKRLKSVAHAINRDEFANLNGKSYSYISEILNSNNEDGQKPFQIKFIPSLIVEKPEIFKAEIIDFLCELCGYESPEKKKTLTTEQELALLKRKIKEHGLEKIFTEN
ncbi:MAG: hypothetical protein A2W75_06830 [Nitrospinae bacterium RIFCSPLOWO2_12_39_15]|nr:MAG: hypothetical protein A2W75_06830 [Nitrospinae bacterium RIFCSPLOWO2_12_39_15]